MIQDIAPHTYDPMYRPKRPQEDEDVYKRQAHSRKKGCLLIIYRKFEVVNTNYEVANEARGLFNTGYSRLEMTRPRAPWMMLEGTLARAAPRP